MSLMLVSPKRHPELAGCDPHPGMDHDEDR